MKFKKIPTAILVFTYLHALHGSWRHFISLFRLPHFQLYYIFIIYLCNIVFNKYLFIIYIYFYINFTLINVLQFQLFCVVLKYICISLCTYSFLSPYIKTMFCLSLSNQPEVFHSILETGPGPLEVGKYATFWLILGIFNRRQKNYSILAIKYN